MRFSRLSSVRPKREKVSAADLRKALDASLERRGLKTETPRDVIDAEFRRSKHFGTVPRERTEDGHEKAQKPQKKEKV